MSLYEFSTSIALNEEQNLIIFQTYTKELDLSKISEQSKCGLD